MEDEEVFFFLFLLLPEGRARTVIMNDFFIFIENGNTATDQSSWVTNIEHNSTVLASRRAGRSRRFVRHQAIGHVSSEQQKNNNRDAIDDDAGALYQIRQSKGGHFSSLSPAQ